MYVFPVYVCIFFENVNLRNIKNPGFRSLRICADLQDVPLKLIALLLVESFSELDFGNS